MFLITLSVLWATGLIILLTIKTQKTIVFMCSLALYIISGIWSIKALQSVTVFTNLPYVFGNIESVKLSALSPLLSNSIVTISFIYHIGLYKNRGHKNLKPALYIGSFSIQMWLIGLFVFSQFVLLIPGKANVLAHGMSLLLMIVGFIWLNFIEYNSYVLKRNFWYIQRS